MTPEELRAAITYANGIDPRVQMTGPNADLWGRTVGEKLAIEVKSAILVYYERPHPSGRERPPVGAADVRKIINDENARMEAQQRALEPPPRHTSPMSYRERDPQAFADLMRQGRDEHRANLQARGIPLTTWQTANDKRPNDYNHNP